MWSVCGAPLMAPRPVDQYVTGARLHLIEPLGFSLDDRYLRRSGMDYWRHVRWHRWVDWRTFRSHQPAGARFWFIESAGVRHSRTLILTR